MDKNHTEAQISEQRYCDICTTKPAAYDAKTKRGPWAWLCKDCFEEFGIGLGLGRGQRLIFVGVRVIPLTGSQVGFDEDL